MRRLVIDSGPFIAFFYGKDNYHQQAKQGFAALLPSSTLLIVPSAIVFEVYKWLLHSTSKSLARNGLEIMLDNLDISFTDLQLLEEIQLTVKNLPDWNGTLEDAAVMLLAQRYQCPLWTQNYRDFGSFKSLEFWVPA